MKKSIIAAVAVFAAAGLAACSQNAQNESAEAANATAADTEATTNESVSDVDAAPAHPIGAAETPIDNAGRAVPTGAARAPHATDAPLTDAATKTDGTRGG